MNTYIILLRGINVGGKNKVPMASLKECLEGQGFTDVKTYIASGNVLLKSTKPATAVKAEIEDMLPKRFTLDSALIKILVLNRDELKSIIDNKPKGFGEEPDKYYSDAIFLIDVNIEDAMKVFDPRDGVDTVWPAKGVVYSRRLGAERTKSRLNKIIGTPIYQSMTIRSWNTTTKLLDLAEELDGKA